ncbi:sensor histidine kinase [Flavobacterium sp. N1736]|uniref:ATP-binding protein n=1 Tax=Flavobacterium sp. N1736 TaxID=2986823 RepID=UPI0022258D14|nr:sensor histidine kinase [Flavobacterium sp. N1736]
MVFFLILACHKKNYSNKFKKAVIEALKDTDSETLKNDRKEEIVDTIFNYVSKYENDSVTRNLYFKIASKYYNIGQYEKFLTTVKKVHNLGLKQDDTTHIAKALYFFGDYYEQKSQLDSAFSYYSQSERLYKIKNDTLNSGRTKLYKAGILFDAGIFSESEIEAVSALRLLSKTNNTRLIYESYVLLAISLNEVNDCSNSLKYFNLALKQLNQLEKENYPKEKIIKSRISCCNNMGRIYEKLNNHKKAIQLYKTALQIKDIKQNYPKSYAMLLDNLGNSQMKIGNYTNVYKLLSESLKVSDSLDIKPIIISNKINIGQYFLFKKDTVKALEYIKEGFEISQKIKSNELTIQSLKLLMENDLENKTYYTNQYLKIDDSLQKVERITRNQFARIAFETDQVEEKNEILSKRNSSIIIGFGIVILFSLIFFIIYRLKSKNKELFYIKEQQEANEKIYQLMLQQQSETELARNEERNRIAMELHDGIVNSVFTTRFNLIQLDSVQTDKKEQLVKELEKTENEIRRVSHNLTQNLLFEDMSFPEIVTHLVESQKNQFDTKFDISVDKYIDWFSVSSINKIHIYRIIQEALQNINKYSNAERCYIMLLKTGDKITIRIWDNGNGFNPEKVKHGIGLKNIEERTNALNGELKITSDLGNGTTIEVIF